MTPLGRWPAVVATVSVLPLVLAAPAAAGALQSREVAVSAAFLTGTEGITAAVLAVLAMRLDRDLRLGWLALALGCYGLVAIPAAAAELVGGAEPAALAAVRVTSHLVVAALLLAQVAGATRVRQRTAAALVAGVAALLGGVALPGLAWPGEVAAVVEGAPVRLVESLAWLAAVAGMAVWTARRRASPLWAAMAGLGLLCVAHVVPAGTGLVPAGLAAALPLVRLVAVSVALAALGRLVYRTVARLDDEQAAREEELCIARVRLSRAAERDHELRNGLAGLAGATGLMRTERVGSDTAALGSAVVSELSRLDDLLRAGPSGAPDGAPGPAGCALSPLLSGLVVLRRSAGMRITLDVEPGLRAAGSSTALAQVVTNLLGNAEVHAPGSPVRIAVHRDGRYAVIRVRDFGPGIPPGQEAAVFERGVRDGRRGGSGLGLHICRRLVTGEGGSIAAFPATPDRPGCTIVVRVPAVPAGRAAEPLMIASGAP